MKPSRMVEYQWLPGLDEEKRVGCGLGLSRVVPEEIPREGSGCWDKPHIPELWVSFT